MGSKTIEIYYVEGEKMFEEGKPFPVPNPKSWVQVARANGWMAAEERSKEVEVDKTGLLNVPTTGFVNPATSWHDSVGHAIGASSVMTDSLDGAFVLHGKGAVAEHIRLLREIQRTEGNTPRGIRAGKKALRLTEKHALAA